MSRTIDTQTGSTITVQVSSSRGELPARTLLLVIDGEVTCLSKDDAGRLASALREQLATLEQTPCVEAQR